MSYGQKIKEINLSVTQLKDLPAGGVLSSETECFNFEVSSFEEPLFKLKEFNLIEEQIDAES